MPRFSYTLSSINDIKLFVNAASACACDVDVTAGRYVVNGKSIMGLFSLDLSQPVEVEVPDAVACEARQAALKEQAGQSAPSSAAFDSFHAMMRNLNP